MNKERLLKLAKFLRTVPEIFFDLDSFAGNESFPYQEGKDIVDCGTTACALGWATTIPEFAAAGLRLESMDHISYEARLLYNGKRNFYAGALFMDISIDECHYLFDPIRYDIDYNIKPRINPNLVADRIEDFVATF